MLIIHAAGIGLTGRFAVSVVAMINATHYSYRTTCTHINASTTVWNWPWEMTMGRL